MRIEAGGKLEEEGGEALAVPAFANGSFGPGGDWAKARLGAKLERFLESTGFTGALGEVAVVPAGGRSPFETVFLFGLGEEADAEVIRQGGGWVGKRTSKVGDVATTIHQVGIKGADAAFTEGFLLGQYRFDTYRGERKPSLTERLRFVGTGAATAARYANRVAPVVEGVRLVRDLVNTPANEKSPDNIADRVRGLAASRRLRLNVLDESEIGEEGLGGLAGVAAGAHNPPRLVELWYEPKDPRAFLALVGKGIVFDSGGLSLKTAEAMETMKTDMAGAATVVAALLAIADLKLPVRVVAIAPLTENMPGGGALRPGDVIRPRGGKSVEVLNTDAEGRLVLADGLALASEHRPDLVVDVATLTGACKTALGLKIAGLWSNDQDAADRVLAASRFTGERMWQMPLPDDYRKNLDSEVADIKNTGGPFGAAINAALFLREFVGEVPWVHIDVAGPARWPDDEHYQTKGGSGFGVRTLVALAEDF